MLKHLMAILIAGFSFIVFIIIFIFISNSLIASMITSRGVATVPDLLGLNMNYATRLLENQHLSIEVIDTEYSEFSEGLIISQIPSSGRQIYQNRTIQVITSRGAKIIDMPDLTGILFQNINEILRTYELRLGTITQHYSTEVQSGFIISTIPAPGQITMAGVEVNFIISIGRDPLDVPVIEFEEELLPSRYYFFDDIF